MPQIITDAPSKPAPLGIDRTLLIAFLVVGLMGVACGYVLGIRDGGRNAMTVMEAQNGRQ